jgi:hydroxymethylpyrimidine/phosphomethylpyrimidine kinase
MIKALTIAGFDPSGGAGLQADLKVFHLLGVYGLSVASSLTAQNSQGVKDIMPVNSLFVKKQLTVLLSDFTPDATKTGMLYSEENVDITAHLMKKYSVKNLVVDPVILSSTGRSLAQKGVPSAIRKKLLPLCTVVTPNIYEASVLTGRQVKTKHDMEEAASRLRDYGAGHVIITGGHLEKIAMDVLCGSDFHYLQSKKIRGEFHGTGCVFSSVLTAYLAQGYTVLDAAKHAKKFMSRAFTKSFTTGAGMHLFKFE